MGRGKFFIIFVAIAVILLFTEVDFDNLSYEENQTEYLLVLAVLLIGSVYLFRRNR